MDGFDLNDGRRVEQVWLEMRARVRRRVEDVNAAEDVVQESWLRALQQPQVPRQLSGWLACVARRLVFEQRRAECSRVRREREVAQLERVESAAGRGDQIAVIRGWVAALPQPYRRVVAKRYLDGEEIADIARELGISEATARSQLKRGLDKLRVRCCGREADPRLSRAVTAALLVLTGTP
jgi:RNA polymerase sigma factor (sigma-70 family)